MTFSKAKATILYMNVSDTIMPTIPHDPDIKPLPQLGQLSPAELTPWIETILFASDKPLSLKKMQKDLGETVDVQQLQEALSLLADEIAQSSRPYELVEIARGYQLLTKSYYAPVLQELSKPVNKKDLSPAVLETLSIIAYKQPITRQDLENIRGVGCGQNVRRLMELKLTKVVGRAPSLGSPLLYGTTDEFLHIFGLKTVQELPDSSEMAPEDTNT